MIGLAHSYCCATRYMESDDMDSSDILSLCKRRGFLFPSYEIYGGVAGMYDYGPLGSTLKNNIMEVCADSIHLEKDLLKSTPKL